MSSYATAVPQVRFGHTLTIYATEAKYELLKVMRQPAYVVPTLTFPVLFYVMFGLLFGGKQAMGPVNLATYLLGTYGAFGVIGASLFGFAVGVATERGFGWLQVKRASPMPPLAYLFGKLVVSMIFSEIVVSLLIVLGIVFGGAHLSASMILKFLGTLIIGSLPFAAMGLAIGCTAAPNSAPAIVNVLFLPMSFLSGLWVPVQVLPHFLQQVAPLLPPYHLAQLALLQVGAPTVGDPWGHVSALAAFTVAFVVLALRGFTREDGKVNG
jgi:ABC-2 type transport system permease protein